MGSMMDAAIKSLGYLSWAFVGIPDPFLDTQTEFSIDLIRLTREGDGGMGRGPHGAVNGCRGLPRTGEARTALGTLRSGERERGVY